MRERLIETILSEMDRVWGRRGLHGTDPEYEWLFAQYGITEAEDVRWQLILEASRLGSVSAEDTSDPDVSNFLMDSAGVLAFLKGLLHKYRGGTANVPSVSGRGL